MDIKKLDQAKDALEMALKARSTNKDAQKNSKKLEEFLKAVDASKSNSDELKSKFKDVLVKYNVLKDEDWIVKPQ